MDLQELQRLEKQGWSYGEADAVKDDERDTRPGYAPLLKEFLYDRTLASFSAYVALQI